jgi:hypothetical protein
VLWDRAPCRIAGKPPLEVAMRDMITKILPVLSTTIPAHYFQDAG